MAWAALWDLVAGSSLLLGAAAGLRRPPDNGGFDAVGNGLVLGALAFTAGDAVIERRGGGDRKRSAGQQEGGSALAIAFGAALDGLPESIVIGAGLAWIRVGAGRRGGVPLERPRIALVRGRAASGRLRRPLRDRSVARGYGHVHRRLRAGARPGGEADPDIVAGVQAFAGGPLLAMLADTMLPEAYQDAGKLTGLVTVLGFALAFFLARLG